MPKSTSLYFTQNLNNQSVVFSFGDPLSVITAAPTTGALGSGLTTGQVTFTANGGTAVTGATPATFMMNVAGGAVYGPVYNVLAPNQTVGSLANLYTAAPTSPNTPATISPAGGTAPTLTLTTGILKLLYTGSTNDAVIKAINVATSDTSAKVVSLWEVDATGAYPAINLLGSVNIPLSSGSPVSGSAPSIDLLGGTLLPSLPYDTNGKRVLPVKAGVKIYVSVPTAPSSGTFTTVSAMIEEY